MNDIPSIISQLEQQRGAIDRALEALREIEGTGTAAPAKRRGRPRGKENGGRRRMSAEARARIGEATRKRWAERRALDAEAEKKAGAGPAKKKRGSKRSISPEGRARIAEAARQMWAKRRKRAGAAK